MRSLASSAKKVGATRVEGGLGRCWPVIGRRVFCLALACVAATACFHSSQAWPVPLHYGTFVTAQFTQPRSIMIGDDSALVATELSGRVVSYHGDTLVVHLGKVPGQETKAWVGRDATFTLDSTTTVRHTEFDEPWIAVGAVTAMMTFLGGLAIVLGSLH